MGLLDFIWKRGSHTQDPLELVPDENDRHALATLEVKQPVAFTYSAPGKYLMDVAGFFREFNRGKIVISMEQERHGRRASGVGRYDLRYVESVSNLSDRHLAGGYHPLKLAYRRKE